MLLFVVIYGDKRPMFSDDARDGCHCFKRRGGFDRRDERACPRRRWLSHSHFTVLLQPSQQRRPTLSRYKMVGQGWTALWVCLILVGSRSFVSTAPSRGGGHKDPADEEVRELEHLKSGNENSMSLMKSHSLVYSNIDGKKEQHEGRKEEVDKNGQLVARMEQELDKMGRNEDHVKTVVDIPSRNLHRIFEHGPKPKTPENNVPRYRSFPGQRYSPVDMAEYIFWTGDERGATNAIEEFLEDGYMSRDQAIKFLEEIRLNLENLKGQYQGQVAPQRNELSDIRQQMRDSMSKKADYQEVDQTGLADEDYEELVDRLRMADLMYNEYSLEEVIYQLAKIMFKQSLTKGSVETQQALQEFTEFLESQAQEGKISQGMQKKVLDIVITSLSDTLTLHPELADTARKSLGLTPMNQGISEGQNNIPLNYQTSRFQEKDKNASQMNKKSN